MTKKGLKQLHVSEEGEIIIPDRVNPNISTKATTAQLRKNNLKKRGTDNEKHYNSDCLQKDDSSWNKSGQKGENQSVIIDSTKEQRDGITERQ